MNPSMKHLVRNTRSFMKYLLFIAAACAASLDAETKQELNWSDIVVNRRAYILRLTEFEKPVELVNIKNLISGAKSPE